MPAVTVCEAGVADTVKSGTAVTTKVTVAVAVKLPLVPFTVRVYVPVGVDELVETFSVELPEPLTEAGENVALAPVGNPETVKPTLLLKPFDGVTVTV